MRLLYMQVLIKSRHHLPGHLKQNLINGCATPSFDPMRIFVFAHSDAGPVTIPIGRASTLGGTFTTRYGPIAVLASEGLAALL
jgi:hypothetical protein